MNDFNYFILLDFVGYFLKLLLLIVTAFFIYWLIADDIKIRAKHYKYRLRKKKEDFQSGESKIPQKQWFKHLYTLFAIRSTKTTNIHVYAFIVVELFLGIGIFVTLVIRLQDAVISMMVAILTVLVPYLFLFISARNIRNEVGAEIQEIVQTLIHSYSAVRGDMYAALNMTHGKMKSKHSRIVLARLISELQTGQDEKSLREIVDFFIYSTGSSWGLRLGNIILKSYLYQENVTTALLTLQKQMNTHQKMLEEEKAGATDVSTQAILSLILLPVSLVSANFLTNPYNWWKLQFGDAIGFFIFTLTIIFVGISGVIAMIVRKPKIDL